MDLLNALEKAMLIVVDGVGVPMMLRFKYNPEQYTVEKSAEWTRPRAPGAEFDPGSGLHDDQSHAATDGDLLRRVRGACG